MSLLKGSGAGCYASNKTLAAEVGCDYSNLSKALSRLVAWGYLVKEKRPGDKRLSIYRVVFDFPDSWSNGQQSQREIDGEITNFPGPHSMAAESEIVGLTANEHGEIVGHHVSLSTSKQTENPEHYIPLNGELYSVETGEENSAEASRFALDNDVEEPDIFATVFDAGDRFSAGPPAPSIHNSTKSSNLVPVAEALPPAEPPQELGRDRLDDSSRVLLAELQQFERRFERRSKDLDLEAWLIDLDLIAGKEGLRGEIRKLASRLGSAVRAHQAQMASVAPPRLQPTEAETLQAIREQIFDLAIDGKDAVSLIAAQSRVPPDAVLQFISGAAPTRKHRLAIQIAVGKLASGNPAVG